MAKEITEITDRIVSVTRRGFLGKAGNVLAASAAPVVPLQLVKAEPSKRAEMASALHDAIGQFTDENLPSHVQVCADGRSLELEIEPLRDCSVDVILEQLRPLYENLQAGGAI